jgi:hypothetical protein
MAETIKTINKFTERDNLLKKSIILIWFASLSDNSYLLTS